MVTARHKGVGGLQDSGTRLSRLSVMGRVQGGGQSNHQRLNGYCYLCAPICLAAASFSPCRSHLGAALDVNQPLSFPSRWVMAVSEAVQRVTRRGARTGRRTTANKDLAAMATRSVESVFV